MIWCAYDKDGAIVLRGTSPDNSKREYFEHLGPVVLNLEKEVSPEFYYVKDGEVLPRPRMSLYVKGKTIAGVLPDSSLTIEGEVYTSDGNDIFLEFSMPGHYRVKISKWPYIEEELIFDN